jgi:hypothetical protein
MNPRGKYEWWQAGEPSQRGIFIYFLEKRPGLALKGNEKTCQVRISPIELVN